MQSLGPASVCLDFGLPGSTESDTLKGENKCAKQEKAGPNVASDPH